MPKTVDARHCEVGLRACNNLLQPPPYILVFGGCGRLLHALTPPRSAFCGVAYMYMYIKKERNKAGMIAGNKTPSLHLSFEQFFLPVEKQKIKG